MATKELMSLTLAEAANMVKTRQVSPVELTQASLERIEGQGKKLNSFITVTGDRALAAARTAEKEIADGDYRGPLHGVPYAVKDIYATRGIRTTNGSKVFTDNVPRRDSTAVRNLNNSGGILVGKNHCLEFASGEHNALYGEVHNPWNLDHTPGGSSSGSAASVAAGLVFGSMGSCTGGSIRGPASHCSVVGLKPTYGLVSRHGVFPLSWSLDHAGPLTRIVEDCALMLSAVAGYDAKDPSSARVRLPDYAAGLDGNIRGMRIGVPRELNEGMNEDVSTLIRNAIAVLEKLGASVEEVPVPVTGDYATVSGNVITWSEAAQVHAPWTDQLGDYTAGVRGKVLIGLATPSAQYHKAQLMRRLVQEELGDALKKYDVLVGPIMASPPGPIQTQPGSGGGTGAAAVRLASGRSFTRPYNITGQPAISVPCGFSPDGLPVGLQIAGALFDDATVLKVAHAYEQATGWHNMHPEL